jgi:acetylornithine deacetylase/succinyl-diaminopimelate desuccinylase-like protein
LDRVDDTLTGKVADVFQSPIPEWKIQEANAVAATQGDKLYEKFPLVDGVKWMNQEKLAEMYLDNVWRPNLSITGAGGLPLLT